MLENLGQFTGTEHWYRTVVPSITYTDGAKYVADQCESYWLLDDIAIYQTLDKIRKEEFQVWKLKVDLAKSEGVLSCEDGNNHVVFTKKIPFTDFPVAEMTLWYVDKVILLPSEY